MPGVRQVEFSFIGLITPTRASTLNAWLERQGVRTKILIGSSCVLTNFCRSTWSD